MSPHEPRHGPVQLTKSDPGHGVEPARPEGCLVAAVRMPVRVLTLVLVLPLRLLWDLCAAAGRLLHRVLLRPAGRALAWLGRTLVVLPARWLWRYMLRPLLYALLVWPPVALWRYVLLPLGRGAAWLGRSLVVLPLAWLFRHLLAPLGRGLLTALRLLGHHLLVVPAAAIGRALAWLGRYLLVVPAVALYRWVLAPVGRGIALVVREIADAFAVAWRVAGRVTAVLVRFLGRVLYVLLVAPFVQLWRYVLAPVGRVLRDRVWRPVASGLRAAGRAVRSALRTARASVRATRAEIRRALFGAPRSREREPLP
ncbi:hypothetical protein SALCHL_002194 [Streptomyces albus subsp. chlorinus]|uniref:hypothetical protein n=1 Tax=Streptomyces albus TaxID=1888 RepID=UPI0015707ED8|nr:hypothetical protein [Streptomyces albus]